MATDTKATKKKAAKKVAKKVTKKVTKKAAKKVTKKAKVAVAKEDSIEEIETPVVSDAAVKNNESTMILSLSKSLILKLKNSAESEGVSIEDLVSEILAEGVTVRAWEILERKAAMKNPAATQQQGQYINQGNNRRNNKNKNRGRMNHSRYNNLMGDKASFMEYVRNTEPR